MNINWKCRFRNRSWLLSFLAALATLVYFVLGMFGVVPHISQNSVVQAATLLVNLLVLLGVVMDPTTKGMSDSSRALKYETPYDGQEQADPSAAGAGTPGGLEPAAAGMSAADTQAAGPAAGIPVSFLNTAAVCGSRRAAAGAAADAEEDTEEDAGEDAVPVSSNQAAMAASPAPVEAAAGDPGGVGGINPHAAADAALLQQYESGDPAAAGVCAQRTSSAEAERQRAAAVSNAAAGLDDEDEASSAVYPQETPTFRGGLG